MLGGDFNVIRFQNERKGACSISSMQDFSNWIRSHDDAVQKPKRAPCPT